MQEEGTLFIPKQQEQASSSSLSLQTQNNNDGINNDANLDIVESNAAADDDNDEAKDNDEDKTNVMFQFDNIQKILYEQATATSSEQDKDTNNTERTKFVLDESWDRGTGGLNDADRNLLGNLYFNADSIFEYGLGESTLIAAAVNVPQYAGVDSDAKYISETRYKVNKSHFRFYFADIGETKAWGYPIERKLKKNLYNYQIVPLALEKKPFEVYIIDGRYRVACACVSFLHAMKYGADMSQVRVGVHDSDRGPVYDILKQIGDIVEEESTLKLWVYKLKKGVTEDDIFKLWEKRSAGLKR